MPMPCRAFHILCHAGPNGCYSAMLRQVYLIVMTAKIHLAKISGNVDLHIYKMPEQKVS